eukprot:TRINITY_DN2552_c0_g1_i9.p1 TRINITY_DN2552_c0_g1~~TRINITY_DN2552_c0_g1_i9.p1  ORF type:complete len:128 (+),score=47.70 TRINITY_DN2552_c0_g1_i9:124-507(+)
MIRRPPRSPLSSSSAASDVYKRQVWGSLGEQEVFECKEAFNLTLPTMKEACDVLTAKLGLAPCEGTQRVAEGASTHNLLLSGVAIEESPVLVRAMMKVNGGVVNVKAIVRSTNEELCAGVAALAKLS